MGYGKQATGKLAYLLLFKQRKGALNLIDAPYKIIGQIMP
jgi:hypothetical protein